MKRTSLVVLLVVLLVLAFAGYEWRNSPLFGGQGSQAGTQLLATANYQCDQGKTIQASYYQGPEITVQPGQMPQPSGTVNLTLSDGRTMTLKQTISADGTRYSNGNPQLQQGQPGAETFVFWSKGNGALVLENNEQKSYIGCVKVADNPGSLPNVYSNGQMGISIRYPQNYTADDTYSYQELGPGKSIGGVKFTIDPAIATGTNLGADSYVSVEQIASSTTCTADMFLDMGNSRGASQLTDGDTTYSYASSTGAGAGNRYEEQVFAIPGSNPCTAVRYFIHYGVFENYPAGSVQQFNEQQLVAQFDDIRHTLVLDPTQ